MPTEREIQDYLQRQMAKKAPVPKQQVRIIESTAALRALEDLVLAHRQATDRACQELSRQFMKVVQIPHEQMVAMKQEMIALNAKLEILEDVEQWLVQAQTEEGVSHGG